MFNVHDLRKNSCMLTGPFSKKGYDWWWHSFTAVNHETGEEKAFFVEFFIINPKLYKDNTVTVLGQKPENKSAGKRPSYLMVKAGTWGSDAVQLHRFFPLSETKIHYKAPYSVSAGDCFASDTELRGSVSVSDEDSRNHPEYMCGSGEMKWNLKLDKKVAFNVGYGTSSLLCAMKAFEMYWHAEGMKTLYSGYVEFNGVRYDVIPEKSYGYADKNWGRGFTSPWVWLSSCNLTSNLTGRKLNDSVFDIGGGKPKIYFIALDRRLLGAFWYEGRPYEFNFSKFWTGTKTEFESHETDTQIIWHVRQENRRNVMVTDVTCEKKDMLLVNYESPDGMKRYNHLFNGGNGKGRIKLYSKENGKEVLIDDITAENIGCEYGEYDR